MIITKSLKKIPISKWVTVSEKTCRTSKISNDIYHSVIVADYVNIIAITSNGFIPLVRQYRPAVERETLELPGGLLEENETPENSVERELFEETGFRPKGNIFRIFKNFTDTGRMENSIHGFFCEVERTVEKNWKSEEGIECILVSQRELKDIILSEKLNSALHMAIIGSALAKGYLKW